MQKITNLNIIKYLSAGPIVNSFVLENQIGFMGPNFCGCLHWPGAVASPIYYLFQATSLCWPEKTA